MRTVALLEVEANHPLKRLSGLVDVAREEGIALLPWTQPYTETGFSDFLAAANALWMPTWTLLTDKALAQQIAGAIGDGKRAFISVDPNERDEMNRFIDAFGIEVTPYRPTARGHSVPLEWTTVRREVEPAAFKDAELLNGVETVTLAYPYHVRISGDATAVVALPNREGLLLDTSTDFFKSSNPSSVNCVVRATAPDGRAELIVAATSLFDDVKLPNAGDARLIDLNQRLAQSVFRWLVDGKQR